MSTETNRTERLEIRLEPGEKAAFQECADLVGASLSTWIRERLRKVARNELAEANLKVPFLKGK